MQTLQNGTGSGSIWKKVRAAARGPIIALIVLFVLLCLTTPSFFNADNFINVTGQITIWGILAFGMTFVIISGGIDLSVGFVLSFATMVFGWAAKMLGLPLGVAIILAILAGALCGLGNGLMVTKAKLPPFIATLAMYYVSKGLAHLITKGEHVLDYPDWFRAWSYKYYFGFLSVTTALFIALIILCWLVLTYREAGRNLYAVGGNPEVARLAGIRVALVTTGAYVVSGMMAGLAGVVYASRVNASTPLAGEGYELKAIAIAVIGGASLRGGVGTIGGTVIGALIVGFLMNGLNLHNMSPHVQTISIGAIIAIAVFFDMLSRRKRS
jgi:ribose transport system permease protein